MWSTLVDLGDPGYGMLAAYKAEGLLRAVPACVRADPSRHRVHRRLCAFYHWCAATDLTELYTLASTIEQWWPAIEAFPCTGITNARSEGFNRVGKLVARNAYGCRNPVNQRLRVRCATTRRGRIPEHHHQREPTPPPQRPRRASTRARLTPWTRQSPTWGTVW